MALAMDFKCPYDGAELIIQSPATPFIEPFKVPEVVEEMIEFEHKISEAVINRLRDVQL
jgi:hypothetical protein